MKQLLIFIRIFLKVLLRKYLNLFFMFILTAL